MPTQPIRIAMPTLPAGFDHVPDVDFGQSLTPSVSSADLARGREDIAMLLSSPGQGYTPELTEASLGAIRRRAAERKAEAAAATQSDFMARGGTGSSTEYNTLGLVRSEADEVAANEELQFLLGAADRAAEDRQFRVNTALGLYQNDAELMDRALGRQFQHGMAGEEMGFRAGESGLDRTLRVGEINAEFEDRERQRALEEKLTLQYIAQLREMEKAAKKRAKKGGIARAIGGGVGAVAGAFGGGLPGAQFGASLGSELGFLFA